MCASGIDPHCGIIVINDNGNVYFHGLGCCSHHSYFDNALLIGTNTSSVFLFILSLFTKMNIYNNWNIFVYIYYYLMSLLVIKMDIIQKIIIL